MDQAPVIEKLLRDSGLAVTGISALHETHTVAAVFTTDDGRVYRVDFEDGHAPTPDQLAVMSDAIAQKTGLKVDWAGLTRGGTERDKAEAERTAASRKASAEDTAAQTPVDTRPKSAPPAKR